MTQAALPTIPANQLAAASQAGIDWESDRLASVLSSERRAWMVAVAAGTVAVLAIVAIVVMMPLKATVPYLIYQDKATGATQVVTAINERDVGYQELNAKFWAKRYVVARESYLYTLLQYDYDTVLRLSADDVGRDYHRLYEGDSSREKRLGSGTEERIKVLSVVLPPDQMGKAVVRFEKAIKRASADAPEPPKTYVATFAFTFKPSMKGNEGDLIENPLGFKVTSYRVDAEIATQGAQK
jgi:type IV secretion system protein VirB8